MAKRIFISFAAEDKSFRDFLVGQARNDNSPFEFVDMSVKNPWDSSWKTQCRTKIKGCDGVIALLSNKTVNAEGALWEIKDYGTKPPPATSVTTESLEMAATWKNRPKVLSQSPKCAREEKI